MLTMLQYQQREIESIRSELQDKRETGQVMSNLQTQMDNLEGALASRVAASLSEHTQSEGIPFLQETFIKWIPGRESERPTGAFGFGIHCIRYPWEICMKYFRIIVFLWSWGFWGGQIILVLISVNCHFLPAWKEPVTQVWVNQKTCHERGFFLKHHFILNNCASWATSWLVEWKRSIRKTETKSVYWTLFHRLWTELFLADLIKLWGRRWDSEWFHVSILTYL